MFRDSIQLLEFDFSEEDGAHFSSICFRESVQLLDVDLSGKYFWGKIVGKEILRKNLWGSVLGEQCLENNFGLVCKKGRNAAHFSLNCWGHDVILFLHPLDVNDFWERLFWDELLGKNFGGRIFWEEL